MEKIKIHNISEYDKEIALENLDGIENVEIANVPWREYLRIQNYNKDKYKMCEICIAEQKKKYNGQTPITCTGLRDYTTALKPKYGDKLDSMLAQLDEESSLELKSYFGVDDWFKFNVRDEKFYAYRWYQDLITSCSAKQKVVRCGRRIGKSYSIIMYLLYRIATAERELNILVAAPQVTMINEISDTLIDITNTLGQEGFIVSKRSSPILEIKFFNGSVLKGITLSNDGKSARGKRADIILIDETDFVDKKAMDAIEAVRLDNPNVELILTSTPKGEGNLYNYSQAEQTKEFHYPSYVIPHYSDVEDKALRASLSEVGFAQEILALFGIDQDSVFQQHFIERSYPLVIKEFYNEDYVLANRSRFIVLIGVDWNHNQNGTRIVVTGYDKLVQRFFVIEKRNISKLKYTQAVAVDLVVELNRKYDADHIMCDEGFGIGQVTELRIKGEEQYGKVPIGHPDLKLVDTMSVQFGSSLEIKDPISNETLKKITKQYIVENAQKLLESSKLALDETQDNDLIMQMKNYNILRTGLRGNIYKPRDKKIGDHDLDAYMLTLFCFDKVYGIYINTQSVESVSIIPSNNHFSGSRTGNEDRPSLLNLSAKSRRTHKQFQPRKRW